MRNPIASSNLHQYPFNLISMTRVLEQGMQLIVLIATLNLRVFNQVDWPTLQ